VPSFAIVRAQGVDTTVMLPVASHITHAIDHAFCNVGDAGAAALAPSNRDLHPLALQRAMHAAAGCERVDIDAALVVNALSVPSTMPLRSSDMASLNGSSCTTLSVPNLGLPDAAAGSVLGWAGPAPAQITHDSEKLAVAAALARRDSLCKVPRTPPAGYLRMGPLSPGVQRFAHAGIMPHHYDTTTATAMDGAKHPSASLRPLMPLHQTHVPSPLAVAGAHAATPATTVEQLLAAQNVPPGSPYMHHATRNAFYATGCAAGSGPAAVGSPTLPPVEAAGSPTRFLRPITTPQRVASRKARAKSRAQSRRDRKRTAEAGAGASVAGVDASVFGVDGDTAITATDNGAKDDSGSASGSDSGDEPASLPNGGDAATASASSKLIRQELRKLRKERERQEAHDLWISGLTSGDLQTADSTSGDALMPPPCATRDAATAGDDDAVTSLGFAPLPALGKSLVAAARGSMFPARPSPSLLLPHARPPICPIVLLRRAIQALWTRVTMCETKKPATEMSRRCTWDLELMPWLRRSPLAMTTPSRLA